MQELNPSGQNRDRLKESVTGLLVIHSAPNALRPHIEWGLQSILGTWLTINCNETETLFRVEPLNCACCHVFTFPSICGCLRNP